MRGRGTPKMTKAAIRRAVHKGQTQTTNEPVDTTLIQVQKLIVAMQEPEYAIYFYLAHSMNTTADKVALLQPVIEKMFDHTTLTHSQRALFRKFLPNVLSDSTTIEDLLGLFEANISETLSLWGTQVTLTIGERLRREYLQDLDALEEKLRTQFDENSDLQKQITRVLSSFRAYIEQFVGGVTSGTHVENIAAAAGNTSIVTAMVDDFLQFFSHSNRENIRLHQGEEFLGRVTGAVYRAIIALAGLILLRAIKCIILSVMPEDKALPICHHLDVIFFLMTLYLFFLSEGVTIVSNRRLGGQLDRMQRWPSVTPASSLETQLYEKYKAQIEQRQAQVSAVQEATLPAASGTSTSHYIAAASTHEGIRLPRNPIMRRPPSLPGGRRYRPLQEFLTTNIRLRFENSTGQHYSFVLRILGSQYTILPEGANFPVAGKIQMVNTFFTDREIGLNMPTHYAFIPAEATQREVDFVNLLAGDSRAEIGIKQDGNRYKYKLLGNKYLYAYPPILGEYQVGERSVTRRVNLFVFGSEVERYH